MAMPLHMPKKERLMYVIMDGAIRPPLSLSPPAQPKKISLTIKMTNNKIKNN